MSSPEKAKGFMGEFKAFIARGNVLDMAVGVGLADYGGAFRRELLELRYRRLFQWLTKNVPCATVSNSG